MASDVTYHVQILRSEENDGPTFLQRGAQEREETRSLHEALGAWDKARIVAAVESALEIAKNYEPGAAAKTAARVAKKGSPKKLSDKSIRAAAAGSLAATKARKQHEKRRIKSGRTPTDY